MFLLLAAAALVFTSSRVFGASPEQAPVSSDLDLSLEGQPRVDTYVGEPVEGSWLRGWIWPAVLIAAAAAAFVGYRFWTGGSSSGASLETASVARQTIRSTVETSASVESQESADLSFAMPGRVTQVLAQLGQRVEAGQPMALLESDSLDRAVEAASVNVEIARLKLTQMLNGATAAEVAAAEQAVSSAEASRDRAVAELRTLEDGAQPGDLAAARAAVTQAEATLAASEDAQMRLLDGASSADEAAAEAAVTTARAALSTAEQTAAQAEAGVSSAESKLFSARIAYCQQATARPAVCSSSAVPLPESTVALLLGDAAGTGDALLAADISALVSANAGVLNALAAVQSASGAIDAARDSVAAAEKKADIVNAPADQAEIGAAEAAVAAARDAVTAARARLTDLEDGATSETLASARSARAAADDAVAAAQAALDELIDGADADDVAMQREQIKSAEITLARAQGEQAQARLVAPFSGVVGAVNVHPGEYASPGLPAFVLLTPGALRLTLVVGETDRPYVELGQQGSVTFDALPNANFAFKILRVGDSPTIEQGVAIYTVEASLAMPADGPRPVPGISGIAEVLIEEKADVLAVPARAVRRIGKTTVVEIVNGEVTEEREVRVGISDGQYVEVISGIAEGDQVLLRAAPQAQSEALPTRERRLPGDIR